MGRPPSNGAPSFRFHPSEVAQMEAILQKHEGHVPPRDLLVALAQRFSQSPERAGKITVQMKQIWNWFQNKRYALRAKLVKSVGKSTTSLVTRNEAIPLRNLPLFPQSMALSSGALVVRNTSEAQYMEFEARSSRDGAWYDVQDFLSHRYIETGNPEVLVHFSGFGPDEDEWRNIRKHVRQRSLPCEAPECIAVLPGDLILCFQEGKEQALYFDALVLDAQRRRHDIRGCRCRFLVRFDHDQSEEIVPLRKICRRPETDYRLQQHHVPNAATASSTSVSVEPPVHVVGQTSNGTFGITNPNTSTALATLIPAASTSASVTPPVHVLGQTNNTTFGITTPNPSTTPVTLIPAASTPVSVESQVHTVGQTNNSIFGIKNPYPNTAPVTLFPSPVLRIGRSGRHLFGPTAPTTSLTGIAATSPTGIPAATVPPGFSPVSTSIVTVTPISTSVQAPSVTVPAGPAPPGFTPLSTSVVTQSSVSTSVQTPPVELQVSTVVTVPVFPASLTPSASFPEPNKVQNDNPTLIPAYATKIETDRLDLLPNHNMIETNHPVSVFKRIKVENGDPAPIPEPNRVEKVNLVTSNDKDSAHANFTIPVEVTSVIEKSENSNPKTTALTRSNVPNVHLSGNPAILVPGQEKAKSSSTEKLKE